VESKWDINTGIIPLRDERVGILESFFELFTGERLGSGASRAVYMLELPSHFRKRGDKYVVKMSTLGSHGIDQNIDEYNTWYEVKYTEYAKWFAPVVAGTEDGRIIIQKFIPDIKPEQLPDKVPAFFTDIKRDNWGIDKGQPICRDYGMNLLRTVGLTKRMKKADWYV